jgi:phospholipid/cholesterol/gamma-HCH transport system substrate-binding protein
MQKAAPSFGRIAVMAGFALSCFGLLLFLWLAFGGNIPLKPKGYRFTASFSEATQLAQEADVRISGVPVGKVKTIEPDKQTGRSDVVIQLDSNYAPLPSDAKAILRQKTLLGETYVELTPGTPKARPVPEGGSLRTAQVSPTVELDEIYRSFDPRTRRAFQVWMQSQAQAIDGHGRDINDALGNLGPFAEDASVAVDILNRQEGAVRRLISNTGVVFGALTERGDQLRGLIENSNRVFATTAARDRELQQTFTALPTFERESRTTLARLDKFAVATNPLVTQLRPAARELSPTLIDLSALSPDLKALFRDLDKLITVSRTGFPAAERILEDLRPLLNQADPALRQVIPILLGLGAYKGELTAFFANTAAATQAFDPGTRLHYLRTTNPLNPENLAAYPRRIGSNRPNPYQLPGGYRKLAGGLEVYENRHCGRTVPTISTAPPVAAPTAVPVPPLPVPVPTVVPVPTAVPVPTIVPPEVSHITQSLLDRINQFAYPVNNSVPSPACKKQGKFPVDGEVTDYPHLKAK